MYEHILTWKILFLIIVNYLPLSITPTSVTNKPKVFWILIAHSITSCTLKFKYSFIVKRHTAMKESPGIPIEKDRNYRLILVF